MRARKTDHGFEAMIISPPLSSILGMLLSKIAMILGSGPLQHGYWRVFMPWQIDFSIDPEYGFTLGDAYARKHLKEMRSMFYIRNIVSICSFILVLAALIYAQQVKAPTAGLAAATPITAPDTTVAGFGDWPLHCSTSEAGRICEMIEALQIQTQGQATSFANPAIGRPTKEQQLKFVAQLPSNITIATRILVETKPDNPLVSSIHRCLPMGCFGDVDLTEDIRKRWQTRSDTGIVKFHDGSNDPIGFLLSFGDFVTTMDAVMKRHRETGGFLA